MDPFSLVSNILQRRQSHVVSVDVQTSQAVLARKHAPNPPHAPTTSSSNPTATHNPEVHPELPEQPSQDLKESPAEETPLPVAKPRNGPQAILPEHEKDSEAFSEEKAKKASHRHSIHSFPIPAPTEEKKDEKGEDTPAPLERRPLQRNNTFDVVHTLNSESASAPPRASMDSSIDRMRIIKPAPADGIQATTMVSMPRPRHLKHVRSSSTPALLASSPLRPPASPTVSTPSRRRLSTTPADDEDAEEEGAEDDDDTEVEQESEHVKVPPSPSLPTLTPPASVVPSAGERDLANAKTNNAQPVAKSVTATTPSPVLPAAAAPVAPQPTPAVTQGPVSKDEMPAPISEPATVTPSPAPAPATATSTASSLLSWGRSAMIPSIPRPSPLMPFRAARSMVSSVTSVGTGLLPSVSNTVSNTTKGLSLPSKEQLSAIPVAGRILNHPAMDSALNYVANKASERGISLAALTGGIDPRYAIMPEDIPYRHINKSLVQQAMTLAALAVQKEESSKSMDDESADDAFELYLAALTTLLNALPVETCDPLRREAFETQLRDFVDDHVDGLPVSDEYRGDADKAKRLRRHRRRRQRQQHEMATTLLQKHSATAEQEPQYQQMRGQQAKQRRQRREQHTKQMLELKKQQAAQQQQQLQKEKEKEKEKEAKAKAKKQVKTAASPAPISSTPTSTIKSGKHSRRYSRFRGGAQHAVADQDALQHGAHPNNANAGLGDTIVSTAVHSAIRLKQSPIPDVVKSCLRTSKTIFHKVDERFHLQDKAWELSKHSIEKAIELDEQYAIHEVVTDTVFATITGLVKAGIAYKESPSYTELRANKAAALEEHKQAAITAGAAAARSQNPQEVQQTKTKEVKETKAKAPEVVPAPAQRRGWRSSSSASSTPVTADKTKKKLAAPVDSDDSDSDMDSEDSDEETVLPSASSRTNSDADEATLSEEEQDEVIELNHRTLRPGKGNDTRKGSFGQSTAAEQVREKIDMFMALKGAASLIVNL